MSQSRMAALRGAAEQERTTPAPGLRERKKARTRLQISDVATGMFLERGFDEVTVAEIAAAADVSVKTIFNYFGSKEDLIFDREPEWLDAIDALAARRGPGYGLIKVLQDDVAVRWPALELGEWAQLTDVQAAGRRQFYEMIRSHPGLRARQLNLGLRMRERFSEVVSGDLGRGPDDPGTIVATALIAAAYQCAGDELQRGLLRGDRGAEIAKNAKAVGLEALRTVATAYAGTPLVDGPAAN